MISMRYGCNVTRLDVALVQLMLVATVGVLFYYMLLSLGSKQMAGLMRVAVIMVAIAVFVPALWGFLIETKAKMDLFWLRLEGLGDKVIFWR